MPRKKKYYQRPDGLYEAIRIIDGKRKAFRGHTEAEVEKKMISYTAEKERGRLFREVAEEWEEEHFPTIAAGTIKCYRPALRRAIETFGDKPINTIRAPEIKRFLTEFSRADEGLAKRGQKTVTNQKLVINLILSHAVEKGDIEYNPCQNVTIPRGLKKERREAASAEDVKKIKASKSKWLFPFILLYAGLRRGEALALTYGDIDRKAGVIHVTKSAYYFSNAPAIKEPKTAAGRRDVPILDPLIPHLLKGRKDDYIFSDNGGETPYLETQYEKHWADFKAETKITCTAHQLRHSYATMLYELGIEVKDAQDLLGHSTAAVTQDIYTHISETRRQSTAALLNKRLKEAENTENTQ